MIIMTQTYMMLKMISAKALIFQKFTLNEKLTKKLEEKNTR